MALLGLGACTRTVMVHPGEVGDTGLRTLSARAGRVGTVRFRDGSAEQGRFALVRADTAFFWGERDLAVRPVPTMEILEVIENDRLRGTLEGFGIGTGAVAALTFLGELASGTHKSGDLGSDGTAFLSVVAGVVVGGGVGAIIGALKGSKTRFVVELR